MRDGSTLLAPPVLLGVTALGIKIILILAFLFKFYSPPNAATWGVLLGSYPAYDKAGIIASLVAAPAYLLKKLAGSSEFRDSSVFWATLTQLQQRKGNRGCAYAVWVIVHVLRTYLVLPCFIIANAALIASNDTFQFLLSNTFAAGLVLDIDELFYWLYIRLGGKIPRADACLLLEAQMQALCDRVVQQKVLTMGIAELILIALMKTEFGNGLDLLWSVPVVAVALSRAYTAFPS
eukprot:CAMPEP_0119310724 /NCGR_PEP_ID=MMETSP1333-20130426/19889_1 /TAXON_ID=418940 /ORGANISM="Scyphosphaera apsteinii, Strain RCC1455" /LENGTH=234 /DNA_ID=CAMNT_0007314959 /DNA_START=230 /DNA_END=934 /DNA_ORIENTATION=-